jgi:ribonuclease HI
MDRFVIRKNKPLSDNSAIYVYTDGACSNNGKPNARAGFGVYFGKDDERNVSEAYNGNQTNNVAELLAIIRALTILKDEIEQGQEVIIYSDSKYAIRCCTTYGEKCAKKDWVNPNSKHKEIPNLEMVQVAYNFCKKFNNIQFIHIAAHTGKDDIHSIGNDNADRLANLAIGVTPTSSDKKKIFLNVPFKEKENAKKLGAMWDASKKKWYIYTNNVNKAQLLGTWAIEN